MQFHDDFVGEYDLLPERVQDELLVRLQVLEAFGPTLGRPNTDTLKGSSFANMKELRFRLDGLWRFAFAFDAERMGIVLVGGNKKGVIQRRFYEDVIAIADGRFATHVERLARSKTGGQGAKSR